MNDCDAIIDRLIETLNGSTPLKLRFRELRACVSILEMHVVEEQPDALVVGTIDRLFTQLAELRGLPDDRRRDAAQAILQIKSLVAP